MSNPVFLAKYKKKYFKMSFAENFTQSAIKVLTELLVQTKVVNDLNVPVSPVETTSLVTGSLQGQAYDTGENILNTYVI